MKSKWTFLGCLLGLPLAAAQSPEPAQPKDQDPARQAQGQALPEISWQAAREHIGKECAVTGRVIMARNIGSRCFLNFHENFRENFTVVINRESYDKFPQPPEQIYADKEVRVVGRIIDYQGKPEIIVTGPEQITIIEVATTQPSTRPAVQPAPGAPASQPAATAPPFDGTITLATYNVLNLFDEHDDPYRPDERTPTKPSEQRERLAATFHAVNADVVALQEVENRDVLEEFNATMLAGLHYREVVLFEGNDNRGIDVAVLSRFPVGPVTSHRHLTHRDSEGKPGRFRRDLLRVRIQPPQAQSFDLFVVHLKSKGGGDPSTIIREAEAAHTRTLLDEILRDDPGAHFVICGDFNDTVESGTIRALLNGPTLKSFFHELPAAQRETYNKAPYKSMIDFIFASPAMAERYQPGSYSVIPGTVESSGSDHNPVSARFRLRQ